MQLLIAKETARQLDMGTTILSPEKLPDFEVGTSVPTDLGTKYGKLCVDSDGFAQVCTPVLLFSRLNSVLLGYYDSVHVTLFISHTQCLE